MTFTPAQTRAAAWALLALVAWAVLTLLAPVLMPFLLAAAMAYVLQPLVERGVRKGLPRWLGAGLAVGLLMLLLFAVLLLIVPVVTQQVPLLREQVPALLERLNNGLKPWAERLGVNLQIDVAQVRGWLAQIISGRGDELLAGLLSSLRIGGSAVAALFGNLFLTPIVAFYLLLDWVAMVRRIKGLVPPRWREGVQGFLDETDQLLGHYLRGQLLVMGALAIYYAVGLALTGLDLALPIGVFTGLAVFVPYLGFGLGMVMAVFAALLEFQSVTGVALVVGVYLLGQLIESFFLTPRLVGEAIGLHPIAVIFALLAFGHLFGFVGVLIALPASAVLLVALRRARRGYLASELYLEGAPADKGEP